MRRLLIRTGLRFENEADEASFVERYILRHRTSGQLLILAGGALQYGFFLMDAVIDPLHADVAHAIQAATFVYAVACAALLSLPGLRRHVELIIGLFLAGVGASFAAVLSVLDGGFAVAGVVFIQLVLVSAGLFPLRLTTYFAVAAAILASAGATLAQASAVGVTEVANGSATLAAVAVGAVAVARRELIARNEWSLMREVEAGHGRVRELLLTMLPADIVDRIQRGETTIADSHGEVAIVFADLVGFTELSRRFSAGHLVELLNRIFSAFDLLAEQHGLERIKTIGDAYMAAGGLVRGRPEAGLEAGAFALELPRVVADISAELGYPLQARVGLHIGPVVAGVIGVRRPAFDCWGESVNLASRLEGAASPGQVLVSEAAYWRLKGRFMVTPLDEIELKGIGATRLYRLEATAHAGKSAAE